jgi:signal transduction histidine kinase
MLEPDQQEAIGKIQLLGSDVAISVDVSWCILGDAALECLKGLPQLQALDLNGTKVTDAGLERLKGLRQLRTLDLSFTRVKGPLDPTEWASQGPQFVGLDADPVPTHAAGLGRGQANERSRHEVKERWQTEEQSLTEQQYLHYLLELQDRDRQLVSYEIHDGFVQQLAAAIMQFAAFSRLKEAGDGEVWKSFEAGLKALNDCMREARRLVLGLRSPILDECGVVAAIKDIISQDSARDKPKIDFVHNLDGERMAPALENTIYRILQEGLTNARRYSQSERVLVRLTRRDRYIRIQVQDWGIGFNPRELGGGHFGLEGIQKRARLFGGSATIKSSVGKGTRIEVHLPLLGDLGS